MGSETRKCFVLALHSNLDCISLKHQSITISVIQFITECKNCRLDKNYNSLLVRFELISVTQLKSEGRSNYFFVTKSFSCHWAIGYNHLILICKLSQFQNVRWQQNENEAWIFTHEPNK